MLRQTVAISGGGSFRLSFDILTYECSGIQAGLSVEVRTCGATVVAANDTPLDQGPSYRKQSYTYDFSSFDSEVVVEFRDITPGNAGCSDAVLDNVRLTQIPLLVSATPSTTASCLHGSETFSLVGTESGSFTYAWRRNGVPINAAANPSAATTTLSITSVQSADAGLYDCVVSNGCGSVISQPAALDVYCDCGTIHLLAGKQDNFSLAIPADPVPQPRQTLQDALGNINPRSLLFFDQIADVNIPSSEENRLFAHSFTGVPSDLLTGSLTFHVKAGGKNLANAEGTDNMQLGFAEGLGAGATFTPPWYRFLGKGNATEEYFTGKNWRKDPQDTTELNEAVITLDLSALPNPKQYGGFVNILPQMRQNRFLDFVVGDETGVDYVELTGTYSNGATVAYVGSSPKDMTACGGASASLAVSAGGTGPLSYEWRLNGTPIPTATNPSAATPTLDIPRASTSTAGSYDCVVRNVCSSSTSIRAILRVCAGDINCDATVDDADFSLFVVAYNILLCEDAAMAAGCTSDLNGDGLVDDADFSIFVVAYNALLCP